LADIVLTRANGYSKEDIDACVARALDALNYDINVQSSSVVIKPNLCYYWDYSTGQTTDPRVVSAIVDWIRQRAGNQVSIFVAEADASAMRTKYAFKALGYERLAREKNLKLVNLSEGEIVDKEVAVAEERFVLPVNNLLLDAGLIINVPKLKTHMGVGFTCALKNMFGAIAKPRKFAYHSKLARTIVGINKIVATDIVVVDCIIVSGKTPKKMGVIMASDDAVATDVIAAKTIGYKPSRVAYLKLAMKEGIGDFEDPKIIANPVRPEDIKNAFPRQNYFLQQLSWKLQLKLLRFYSKISKDVIPPILDE